MCAMGLEKLTRLAKVDYGFPFDSNLFTDNSVYMPLIRIRDIKPAKASTYYEGEYSDRYVVRKGEILVGMDGEFNLERWNDRDGLLNQRILRIKAIEGLSDESYLYHLLAPLFKNIEKKVQGGSVKHLSAKIVESLYIPYVDFEEQVLIGKQLDTFTTLISNLESELDMRRKQYEHYRNQLMDFEGVDGVEWKKIGDLFEFKNGLNKEKQYFGQGTPIVNYTDVYHNRKINGETLKGRVTLTDSEIQRYMVKRGDVFFTRTSETREEIGLAAVLLEDIEDCTFSGFLLRARPITEKLISEFCGYYFTSHKIRQDIIRGCTFTTRALTNGSSLSKIEVAIPSKQIQQEIVEKLDAFERLIQSLETEIKLRKQQYEYYREKLLTFEKE